MRSTWDTVYQGIGRKVSLKFLSMGGAVPAAVPGTTTPRTFGVRFATGIIPTTGTTIWGFGRCVRGFSIVSGLHPENWPIHGLPTAVQAPNQPVSVWIASGFQPVEYCNRPASCLHGAGHIPRGFDNLAFDFSFMGTYPVDRDRPVLLR